MGLSVKLRKRLEGFELDVSWNTGNELAVIFGCSGAGKSLTLQMIAGLVRPDEGRIEAGGGPLFDSTAKIDLRPQQRAIGYLFQDLALFPHMTALENIIYGSKGASAEEAGEIAAGLMKSFRLEGLSDRRPSELSGGQKQRVALARALIRRPKVLLLDEPFSALDMPMRIEMRNMLREIRTSFNIPVLLITHDPTEARELADHMIVYDAGRVLQAGTPDEIFLAPACGNVERLTNPEKFRGGFEAAILPFRYPAQARDTAGDLRYASKPESA